MANWEAVFESAARRGVAIEIDGDPARQDLDHTLARQDTTSQLAYAETAVAHARLAAIPADRIVNCWPFERLLGWLQHPTSECGR